MLNFKSFGCKIGEDSLQARLKMAAKKSHEAAKIMEKRNNLKRKRKLQYDELKKKLKMRTYLMTSSQHCSLRPC